MFKFIAPMARVDELTDCSKEDRLPPVFQDRQRCERHRRWEVGSSEEAISFYPQAKNMEGVIALEKEVQGIRCKDNKENYFLDLLWVNGNFPIGMPIIQIFYR